MMKLGRSLITLLFILIGTISVEAQDIPISNTGWPISKRCLGELPSVSLPREKWTFDGVIFTDNRLGVRAIRTDVPTSYYVALDGDNSFAIDGSFSPDGKLFAYPTGSTSYATMSSNAIRVNAMQVVSTDFHQSKLTISWDDFSFSGEIRGLNSPRWLDNNHFVSDGGDSGQGFIGIVDASTGDVMPWSGKTSLKGLFNFSPDGQFALFRSGSLMPKFGLYEVNKDALSASFQEGFRFLAWMPASSALIGTIYQKNSQNHRTNSLIIFDKNGLETDYIVVNTPDLIISASISRDGKRLAFFVGNQLYVAELETKQVVDLCFSFPYILNSLAWSPDNINFVINGGGFPIIINFETLEMQTLRYEMNSIWGWYPVD